MREIDGKVSSSKYANITMQPGDRVKLTMLVAAAMATPAQRDAAAIAEELSRKATSPPRARRATMVILRPEHLNGTPHIPTLGGLVPAREMRDREHEVGAPRSPKRASLPRIEPAKTTRTIPRHGARLAFEHRSGQTRSSHRALRLSAARRCSSGVAASRARAKLSTASSQSASVRQSGGENGSDLDERERAKHQAVLERPRRDDAVRVRGAIEWPAPLLVGHELDRDE